MVQDLCNKYRLWLWSTADARVFNTITHSFYGVAFGVQFEQRFALISAILIYISHVIFRVWHLAP